LAAGLAAALSPARAALLWIEGEKPTDHQMHRHPWWYDQVQRDKLSGGDFISNFDKDRPGEAEYRFDAPAAGDYDFWVHANPVLSRLTYRLNGAAEQDVDFTKDKRDEENIAADHKPDLRFIAWIKVGKVALRAGANTLRFRMANPQSNHGILDCFVLSSEPFTPQGILKPGERAAATQRLADENKGWFAFNPPSDDFKESPLDLRSLNEPFAGEHGFIGVKNGEFVRTGDQQTVRFWAVNGPPNELKDPEALRRTGRLLAKHGVNLVRAHGRMCDDTGEVSLAHVRHLQAVVAAMKAAGVYTHCSIYFPLWLTPKADNAFLKGYDGAKKPFAALLFNPEFQAQYRKWWDALLLTPDEKTGRRLVDDPAVFGLELQNEDSFFFWTFSADGIPDTEMRILEKRFGDWTMKKYGSLETALTKWNHLKAKRDSLAEGRLSFRPLWNMFNEKTLRDQDTAEFLFELQTRFYTDTIQYLRKLGFKGVLTPSNWITASPEVLTPLEKLSYTVGDFIDRHGYFSCNHKGANAEWSVQNGHTYADRSALRFDPEVPGKPKEFVHPVMDPHYNGMPSMISETTFNRPNRYRSEAPLYYAVFGALQHSDALVHFALDGSGWNVKPNYFMQPWTLMSPAMMGQFPATALIFRQGLVASGKVLAEVTLNQSDLLHLKGTPLPQDASLDELRLKDVPQGGALQPGQRVDPLLHYAGRADIRFSTAEPGSVKVADLKPYVNRQAQTVTSSTGETVLDYGKGLLTVNAPAAQALSGALQAAGNVELRDLSIVSEMDLGHIIVVALDGQPLATSARILLQVMSEEKSSGFQTQPASAGVKKILSIGRDPWLVKECSGVVKFKRADAAQLQVTALDFNGYPAGDAGTAAEIRLKLNTVYYFIQKRGV